MNFLNKLFISFITFNLMCLSVFALDLDTSVDDEIRKQYNPDKIEEDMMLPPLPNILKEPNVQQTPVQKSLEQITIKKQYNGNSLNIKKGTKFKVRLASTVSDRTPTGTKINFNLTNGVKSNFFALPANTKFQGVVVNSHPPQLSANGGLIVIKVDNVVINGQTQDIDAYITKANYKKIYFNNIKGSRKYMKNMISSMKPGKKFYDKMWKTTKNLANDGVSIILTPFSLATGVLIFGANIATSPIFAMFSKGGSISIPSGSSFEIKLIEDSVFYN